MRALKFFQISGRLVRPGEAVDAEKLTGEQLEKLVRAGAVEDPWEAGPEDGEAGDGLPRRFAPRNDDGEPETGETGGRPVAAPRRGFQISDLKIRGLAEGQTDLPESEIRSSHLAGEPEDGEPEDEGPVEALEIDVSAGIVTEEKAKPKRGKRK